MSDRVLITPRHLAHHTPEKALENGAGGETAGTAEGLARLGLRVEQELPYGLVVSREGEHGGGEPWREVEALGYRVKRIRDYDVLEVGEHRIDVKADATPAVPPGLAMPAGLEESWPHHLVQFGGPPTTEWIQRIEEEGVDVVEPVSRYALFVCAEPNRVARLRELTFVAWTGPFLPAYRVSRELLTAPAEVEVVNVGVYPYDRADEVAAAVREAGGEVLRRWERTGAYRDSLAFLVARMAGAAIPRVAAIPWVRSVHRQATRLHPTDERAVQIVAPRLDGRPAPATAPVRAYRDVIAELGLDGSGVVIGFCDTGVDTNDTKPGGKLHRDLEGRMAFFVDVTGDTTLVDKDGHGTYVAGAAVGSGASGASEADGWLLGQGVAPGARFGCVNAVDTRESPGLDGEGFAPGLEPLTTYTRSMLAHGTHVMNNSWGQELAAGYTPNAALVDRLVRDPNADDLANDATRYLVIVFSAGNDGPAWESIREPAEAKNAIVVGSSCNARGAADIRGVADSSSRGPSRDGRILPTVVAPGEGVVSTRTTYKTAVGRPGAPFREKLMQGGTSVEVKHDDYTSDNGTSVAAAHVTGVCALIIQWWGRHSPGTRPSPAMVRALLVNGATDLAGGPGGKDGALGHVPNCDQGWGRVCLANIVAREPKLLRDQNQPLDITGLIHRRVVEPADPTRQLRITLAWTDPPAAALSSTDLLRNDLDLEVVELDTGFRFKGNVFDRGVSVPDAGDFDDVNNLECVYVDAPTGRYEVLVIAALLQMDARPPFGLQGWQDYALVIDNAREIGALELRAPGTA